MRLYVPPSCSMSVILTDVAQTSMGLNNASLSHPRSCQSSLMVPHRPLDARLHPLHRRRHNRSGTPPRLKPRRDAFTCSIFSPEPKLLPEPRTIITARSFQQRYNRGGDLDSKRAILFLRLFWEYRTQIGIKRGKEKFFYTSD
jgi:hypothetical protein